MSVVAASPPVVYKFPGGCAIDVRNTTKGLSLVELGVACDTRLGGQIASILGTKSLHRWRTLKLGHQDLGKEGGWGGEGIELDDLDALFWAGDMAWRRRGRRAEEMASRSCWFGSLKTIGG